jgi:hypothetical protein
MKGVQSGVLEAEPTLAVGKKAADRAALKWGKYGQACEDAGFVFIPFIIESSGYMHEEALALLRTAAKTASAVRSIDGESIYQFFLKRISICFQRAIAENINRRSAQVKSRLDDSMAQQVDELVVHQHVVSARS